MSFRTAKSWQSSTQIVTSSIKHILSRLLRRARLRITSASRVERSWRATTCSATLHLRDGTSDGSEDRLRVNFLRRSDNTHNVLGTLRLSLHKRGLASGHQLLSRHFLRFRRLGGGLCFRRHASDLARLVTTLHTGQVGALLLAEDARQGRIASRGATSIGILLLRDFL